MRRTPGYQNEKTTGLEYVTKSEVWKKSLRKKAENNIKKRNVIIIDKLPCKLGSTLEVFSKYPGRITNPPQAFHPSENSNRKILGGGI